MTRDDIIKALDWHAPTVETGPQSLLQRIETLVAQAEADEREACAKLCEEPGWNAANWCAKAIRARGNHEQA